MKTPAQQKQHKSSTPRLVFKTPLRECSHADRGCCPKCLDPMNAPATNLTFRLGRHLFRGIGV